MPELLTQMHHSTLCLLKDFKEGFLDLAFPPLCLVCRERRVPDYAVRNKCFLCLPCHKGIRINRPPFCVKCSRPLKTPASSLCHYCRHRNLNFDRAWGACLYNDTFRLLLHQLKYGHKTVLRHLFAELLIRFVATYRIDVRHFDIIIPIPLHEVRRRERGFNQSQAIAERFAGRMGVPLLSNILVRRRPTLYQAQQHPKERWTNLAGAFKIKNSMLLRDRSILIIDDLLTSGATASEAARCLKAQGARRVSILTVAIAAD
jgi:ComF family protein